MPEVDGQDLSGVAETLAIEPYLRAMESQRPDALIKDDKVVALVTQMSYDFDWLRRIPMSEASKLVMILRGREFHRYARDFLARRQTHCITPCPKEARWTSCSCRSVMG